MSSKKAKKVPYQHTQFRISGELNRTPEEMREGRIALQEAYNRMVNQQRRSKNAKQHD